MSKIFDNIKEAIQSVPTKLNNVSSQTVHEFGEYPIQSAFLVRTPIEKVFTRALNVISAGKFSELQDKHDIPVLYHVAFVGSFNNKNILIEKNEVINVDKFKQSDIKKNTETLRLTLKSYPTLAQILTNTVNYMGDTNFFDYDALGADGKRNNCQDFVMALLDSNNMATPEAKNFIYQNITPITKELPNVVAKAVKVITQAGSVVSRLIGRGKQDKIDKRFINFIKRNRFRFI